MTMIAGGDDGTEKAARVLARRPTIRPRPVTPPRTATPTPSMLATPATLATPTARAWKLPPVRSPRIPLREPSAQAGAATRPVLLLVADASDQFEIALRYDERAAEARRNWRAPRTIALATASAVVLAVAASLVGWTWARPSEQLATSTASARAATTATGVATPTRLPAPKAAEPAAPAIPLVDVKSLPPAPRAR